MLRTPLLSVLFVLLMGDALLASKIRVPGDFATIQEAVNAAQPGDKVVIESGSYIESVLITTDRVTLIGKPGHEIVGPLGSPFAVGVSLAEGVVLRKLNILGFPDVGIDIDGCTDVLIKRCKISGTNQFGIQVLGSTGTRVRDNDLTLVPGYGISLGILGEPGQTITDSTVTNNSLLGVGQVGIASHSGANTITRNTITDGGVTSGSVAIFVSGTGTAVKRNRIIRFGSLTAFGGSPMQIEGDDHFVVRNVANDCGQSMTVDGLTHRIIGNVLIFSADASATGNGILLSGVGSDLMRNTVRRARANGIAVSGADHLLKKNKVLDAVGDGICVLASGVTVQANKVFDSGKDGIDIDAASNMVLNNVVKRSANDGIEADVEATNCLFQGNKVTAVDENGFHVKSGSHTFKGNSASGSGFLDLQSLVPPEANTYIGNDFKKNNLLD